MFKDISWTDYIKVVSAMTILYYLVIAVIIYRKKILSLFKTRYELEGRDNALAQKEHSGTISSDLQADREFEDSNPQEDSIEQFAKDLRVLLESKSAGDYGSEDLFEGIRTILSRFPSLYDEGLRASINEFILSECERCQIIIPDVDEFGAIWKGAV